ncbi:DNA/RNA-binding protein KIN17-like [Patiria miniata]|uniref:DNA/RNA-binding protein Kin17 WH-like domain-containing protein n=1 Tax=Patiria miniata TaxID=46514 RepID=A0A914AZV6_PATMI|nr:DNA/RNA-binding protein KIN17-like [Patiria miniata]
MPKQGFLTPKAIANRIKSKGLQKLRWFCQMCQKQCRDENGFKCHTMSESHQRQLLLFAENEEKFLDHFSEEFFDTFMELLRRRFNTRRVHCNVVYNEYIQHKDHCHMNATKWETLTEFVKWLGREGFCKVDQTEKGWFIAYIDRDPETIARQESLAKKEKLELDDEERTQRFIQRQVEKAAENKTDQDTGQEYTELQREEGEGLVSFNLGQMAAGTASKTDPASSKPRGAAGEGKSDAVSKDGKVQSRWSNPLKDSQSVKRKDGNSGGKSGKRKSALEEIIEEEERKKKAKVTHTQNWLTEGIVVKITTKRLGDRFYKKKGVITKVENMFTGIVKMIDSGAKLKVDQLHVETVIPSPGRMVAVVNGPHRGQQASLVTLQEEACSVVIKLQMGPMAGKTVSGIPYEDISKLAPQDT